MEQRRRALFLFAATLAGSLVVVAACGETDSSTFNDPGIDASTDHPGSFLPDGGSSSGGEEDAPGAAKCEPNIPPGFKPTWTPPTAQKVCSPTAIESYFDACLNASTPDAGAACAAWTAANGDCAPCVETATNSGPVQWHNNRLYFTLNVAGCLGLKTGDVDEDSCASSYAAAIQCRRDACAGCFKTGSSTFADFQNCQNGAAELGFCKSLESQQSMKCAGIKDAGAPTLDCFAKNNENPNTAAGLKALASRIIGIFCAQ